MRKTVLFSSIAVSLTVLALTSSCGRKVKGSSEQPSNPTPPSKEWVCTKKDQSIGLPNADREKMDINALSDQMIEDFGALGLDLNISQRAKEGLISEYSSFKTLGKDCDIPGKFICISQNSEWFDVATLKSYTKHSSLYVREMTVITGIVEMFILRNIPVSQSLIDTVDSFKGIDIKLGVRAEGLTKEEYYDIVYGLGNVSDEVCEYK